MLAKALTIILPVALPFLVYAVYLKYARAKSGDRKGWAKAPWLLIGLSAAALTVASLLIFRVLSGEDPHSVYVAPSFDPRSNEILPGHMEQPPEAGTDDRPQSLRPPAER
jgi:hypothetical protein